MAAAHLRSLIGGPVPVACISRLNDRKMPARIRFASRYDSSNVRREGACSGGLGRPSLVRCRRVVPVSARAVGSRLSDDANRHDRNRLALHLFITHQMSHAMSVEPSAEAAPRSMCLMRPDQARWASRRSRRMGAVHFEGVVRSFLIALGLCIFVVLGGEFGQFR